MVQNGSTCGKKNTHKIWDWPVSPKQSEASILIFEYIEIFWTDIFIRQNI